MIIIGFNILIAVFLFVIMMFIQSLEIVHQVHKERGRFSASRMAELCESRGFSVFSKSLAVSIMYIVIATIFFI